VTRLPDYDEQWGEEFVTQMREHMDQLYASVDAEEQLTVSGQPFCGCQDCDERERYLLAIILILEGHEQGRVRLVDVER
jgi:hypothetical protein